MIVKDVNGIVWEIDSNGTTQSVHKVDLADKVDLAAVSLSFEERHNMSGRDPTKLLKWYHENFDLTLAERAELEGQAMHVLTGAIKRSALPNGLGAALPKHRVKLYVGVDDGFLHKKIDFYLIRNRWSTSEFEWRNLKFNVDLPDSLFEYTPPAGVEVIDRADELRRALEQHCLGHLRQLGVALRKYAEAHEGRLPEAPRWREALIEAKLIQPDVLTCRSRADDKCAYALNVQAGDNTLQWRNPGSLVLLFESQSKDATGDATALLTTPPHAGKLAVLFADGQVQLVTLEEARKLRWAW